jgi:hypothetical protein
MDADLLIASHPTDLYMVRHQVGGDIGGKNEHRRPPLPLGKRENRLVEVVSMPMTGEHQQALLLIRKLQRPSGVIEEEHYMLCFEQKGAMK